MKQLDWVSEPAPPAASGPRAARGIRPSSAEQKAERLLVLGRYINTVPPSVRNGSVNLVRQWRDARDRAAKVAASTRSTLPQIESAINSLVRFA